MASNPLHVNKWDIGDTENAKYCPVPYGSSRANSLQLYIPTLMPLIGGPSKPTQVISSLSSSCFLNDVSCKPSVAGTIRTQNYKTVPVYDNRDFKYPYFYNGANLLVEVINKDVHNMRVSNKIDESTIL